MTTFIAFTPQMTPPSNNTSPPFTAVFILDGKSYQGVVTWNFATQRWYLTLTNNNNVLAWCGPLIGSPLNYNIYLAPGIFSTSTLLYREDTGNFEVNP